MAKKLPELFEPGELERTRRNLGEISEAEARRLREKLGGQLGVEKTPPEIEEKYRALRERNFQRGASGLVGGPPRSANIAPLEGVGSGARMRLTARWKLDWHLTRYEYRAKSFWQVLSLLWNPKGPDRPRRDWILEADRRWFQSLENLVLAVRGMTSRQHKNALQSLRRLPLFFNALKVLREWDIETVARQLEDLQRAPQRLTFRDLRPFAQTVLKPFLILSALDPTVHLQGALGRMYDLARMYLVQERDLDRLRKYYVVAREELPLVFPLLGKHFYPVLIKLLGKEFLEEKPFWAKYWEEVLRLVAVDEGEILRPEREIRPQELRRDVVPEPVEDQRSQPEERRAAPMDRMAARGRDLLEKLFPESGFASETGVDFWAYFSPLFNFPRGAELIDPDDPLARVLALAVIVDQFFFGMENFRLNPAFSADGVGLSPRKRLDQLASEWRRAINEIFTRRYLNDLVEYCRRIEQDNADNVFVRRIAEQLHWLRKEGVLPHQKVPLLKEVRPQPIGAIPLSRLVRELGQFLIALAVDTEKALRRSSQEPAALLNPLEMFKFDIDSALSRRLHSYFRKVIRLEPKYDPYVDNRTNRNFLFVCLTVVQYLDYLLNEPGSPANREVTVFHRHVGPSDLRPVYNVKPRNTPEILVRANHQDAMNQKTGHDLPVEDDLGDFYSPWMFLERLKDIVGAKESPEGGIAFLRLYLGKDIESESLNVRLQDELNQRFAGESLVRRGNVFQLILIGPEERTVGRLREFLVQCAEPKGALPIHAVWVGFHRALTVERLQNLGERGLVECSEYPPQVLGAFDHEAGAFRFAEDLPVCEAPRIEEWTTYDASSDTSSDEETSS